MGMEMNQENAIENSPDINQRRLNGKAGVSLAPLGHAPQIIGRQSMMSTGKEDNNNSDSHPILRVQNYKKPTL